MTFGMSGFSASDGAAFYVRSEIDSERTSCEPCANDLDASDYPCLPQDTHLKIARDPECFRRRKERG
jgi:hypothetical protein